MTKRDVAIWFCKVLALMGIVGGTINVLSGLIGLQFVGGGNMVTSLPAIALYIFVWLFASGIGTELAAEGEHGPAMTSGAELGTLLVRCAGLWLFLSAALSVGLGCFVWAYEYFVSRPANSSSLRFLVPYYLGSFVQSVLGFLLAFTPRIRRFLGK